MSQLRWLRVRREERVAIGHRRVELGVPTDAPHAGLALSGGGIRSATFSLGVLEALKARGLLSRFDYLSSVSGGGYIASWLSANCWRRRLRHGHGDDWLAPGADWSDGIKHLSRYSNYLSPQVGFFSADTWSMLMIWLRNTTLVQALVIVLLATVLMVPPLVPELFSYWPHAGKLRWATIVLFVIAVMGVAVNQLQLRHRQALWLHLRPGVWLEGAACTLILLGITWLVWHHNGFDPWKAGEVSPIAFVIAALITAAALALVPALLRFKQSLGMHGTLNYGQTAVQVFVVLPLLVTAVLVAAILWGMVNNPGMPDELRFSAGFGTLVATAWHYWPFPLSFAFDSFLLFGICALQSWTRDATPRAMWRRVANIVVAFVSAIFCAGLLHVLLCGAVLLLRWFAGLDGGVWHAFVWMPPLLLMMFAMCVTVLIGLLGRASLEGLREWWSRLGAWLCIYAFAWGFATVSVVYGPYAIMWLLAYDGWPSLVPLAGWLATTVGGLLAARSSRTSRDDKIRSSEPGKVSQALEVVAQVAPFVYLVGVIVLVATTLHVILVLLDREEACYAWAVTDLPHYWSQARVTLETRGVVLGACTVLLAILAWRIDINEFGLNQFYRNRLVRCYLGASRRDLERKPQAFTQFDEGDDVPMPLLAQKSEGRPAAGTNKRLSGPLHIVNCALNLGGTRDLALHTRHSASFVITPFVIGSPYFHRNDRSAPAYRSHADFLDGGRPVTLGQAVAVSGAAASPNMGFHTSPIVSFMMTMFNARLGWWFANPSVPRVLRCSPAFSLRYLVMELFGAANERSNYLMVSDGGHFENLGVYELVRRECDVIVAVDAECDRDMTFGALGTLIRMCAADFDASIAIDVAPLALDAATHRSRASWAIGDITYRSGRKGTLVYVKASMTGRERDASVRQYRATHPDFPHESTGDQFYGEDQFESYRRLGRHIASTLFDHGLSQAQRMRLRKVWPQL